MPKIGFKHSEESKEKMRGKRPFSKPWNKGKKDLTPSWNKGKKGKESHLWKGDETKYEGKHTHLRRTFGSAKDHPCMMCNGKNLKGRMEWANVSGLYKRELIDWITLCLGCHRQFELLTGRRKRAKEGTYYWKKKYDRSPNI